MKYETPLISVLVAAYNVEQFMNATFASLDNQLSGLSQIEVVIVNDGSTDSTLEIATQWAKSKPNVKVIDKANGGAASARKVALENSTGTWVTAVDPDDILDESYFLEILRFLEMDGAENANMLVTRILTLNDSNGRVYDNHPLRFRFKHGTRIVSLTDEPDMIQLGATALILREVLEKNSLTYDTRIEPTFEDAHLLGRYLSTFEQPMVAMVPRAKYYYRKRADASSLVQSSWSKHERFSTVLRFGYLDLLKQVHWTYGYVPTWAQNMVLYDIFWYFKEDSGQYSRAAWIDDDLREEFISLLHEIFRFISVEAINRFWINPIWWTLRQVVITYFKSEPAELRVVQWSSSDKRQETNFSILQHPSNRSHVEFWFDGELVNSDSENFVVHSFFGLPMLRERSVVIPRGRGKYTFLSNERRYYPTKARTKISETNTNRSSIELQWKNADRNAVLTKNKVIRTALHLKKSINIRMLTTNHSLWKVVSDGALSLRSNHTRQKKRLSAERRIDRLRIAATTEPALSKYADAWIVMDRPDKADDNGEHFYRYLRDSHAEVNSYFVLNRSSPDWSRLSNEGFQLLEPDSDELVLAILNAKYRISSDAVAACMYPVARNVVNSGTSKFFFLQHGVLMNDLSRWLNPKDIRAISVSTHDELEDLIGENSPYVYRKDQVIATGLARFDKLLDLSNQTDDSSKNRIIIMPTWRQHLRDTAEKIGSEKDRQEYLSGTRFFSEWMKIIHSSRLRQLCEEQSVTLTFIAHPAFRELIKLVDFPHHVEVADLSSDSIQPLLAKAKLFVTDYSSVAFDATYIDCPTVYFQFDRDEVFSGTHNFRAGYFDYKRHGMGPVLEDSAMAVSTISSYVEKTFDDSEYVVRRNNTFINIDTENCSRIFEAIKLL